MATDDKYDRQLRLWGASGQRALGETCVVLVNATAAGTETLKNLVLPGVGRICVIDQAKVSKQDVSSNFFLPKEGASRAQVALEYLCELNPDVQGEYKEMDLATCDWKSILNNIATTSKKKLLVVASDLPPSILLPIAQACQDIPLVNVVCYGLLGICRLQIPSWPIIDPKPRDQPPDLRLVKPFDALKSMADSVDWDTLDSQAYGHVPYPLVLYRIMQDYKSSHNGQLPQTFAEKQEFSQSIATTAKADYISRIQRQWVEKGQPVPKTQQENEEYNEQLSKYNLPENYAEAQKNAYLAYTERTLDSDILQELIDKSKDKLDEFHTLLVALKEFIQQHDRIPTKGTIPDMTASSQMYVKLQKIYQEQGQNDVNTMRSLLPKTSSISDEKLLTFCHNIMTLDVLNVRSLHDEYKGDINDDIVDDLGMATMEGDENPDQLPMLWYIGYRACQLYHDQHGRYPGTDANYESDVSQLQECIKSIVEHYKLADNELVQSTLLDTTNKYATELTRYGNAEIHNVASVIGGVASQEAVKLITGQYVPLNNTYIYNGIASTGGVYQF